MGLIRDIVRGFGLGLGFKVADDVYDAAKEAVTEKKSSTTEEVATPIDNEASKE